MRITGIRLIVDREPCIAILVAAHPVCPIGLGLPLVTARGYGCVPYKGVVGAWVSMPHAKGARVIRDPTIQEGDGRVNHGTG